MAINFSSGGTQERPAITRITSINGSGAASIDFEGIPSNVRRINVWFNQLGYSSGASRILIQIGDSGGIETANYDGHTSYLGPGNANNIHLHTNGVPMWSTSVDEHISGCMTIDNRIDTNTWIFSGAGLFETSYTWISGGRKTLSGTLDRVRVTTDAAVNFDQGNVWVTYEG